MKNNLIKLTYLCILTSFIFLCFSSLGFAEQLDVNLDDIYNKSDFGTKLLEIINTIRGWAFAIITLSAVATAILYITSSFNSDTRSWAKASIAGLIIGITVLLLSNSIGKLMYGILTPEGSSLINATADGSDREFGDITKFGNKITNIEVIESGKKEDSTKTPDTTESTTNTTSNPSNNETVVSVEGLIELKKDLIDDSTFNSLDSLSKQLYVRQYVDTGRSGARNVPQGYRKGTLNDMVFKITDPRAKDAALGYSVFGMGIANDGSKPHVSTDKGDLVFTDWLKSTLNGQPVTAFVISTDSDSNIPTKVQWETTISGEKMYLDPSNMTWKKYVSSSEIR